MVSRSTLLDMFPEHRGDDPQLRRVETEPLGLWSFPLPSGSTPMNHLRPVPQNHASVEITLEDVSQGRRTPTEIASMWRRYPILV
jgi:hypothetical protein